MLSLYLAIVLLLVATPCHATLVLRQVSLEWMLQKTGFAFGGTVRRSEAVRDSATGWVITQVVFTDLDIAYGLVAEDSLMVKFLGGTLAGWNHLLDIQPRFEVGRRYVALIGASKGTRETSYLPAVGGPLGTFRVSESRADRKGAVQDYWGRPVLGIRADSFEVLAAVPKAEPGGKMVHDSYAGTGPFRPVAGSNDTKARMTEGALLDFLKREIGAAKKRPPAPM